MHILALCDTLQLMMYIREGKNVEQTYKANLQKMIEDFYPAYLKKELLKQVVNNGLVINNKKRSCQLSLKFADIVDVSEYDTLEEKVNNILDVDSVLKYIEEFEYKRQYRHFCYFKCSEIPLGDKEMMDYVRNYLIKCDRELENCISPNTVSEKEV